MGGFSHLWRGGGGGKGDALGRTVGSGCEEMGHAARPHLGPALLCFALFGWDKPCCRQKSTWVCSNLARNRVCNRACNGVRNAACSRVLSGCPRHRGSLGLRSLLDASHAPRVPRSWFCRRDGVGTAAGSWLSPAPGCAPVLCPKPPPEGQGACCRHSTLLGLYFLGFAATSWNNYFLLQIWFRGRGFALPAGAKRAHGSHAGFVSRGLSPQFWCWVWLTGFWPWTWMVWAGQMGSGCQPWDREDKICCWGNQGKEVS